MKDNPIFDEDPDERPKGSPGHWIALVLVAVVLALGIAVLPGALAHAQEPPSSAESQHPQQEIERTTAEYENACKQLEKADKAVADNKKRIAQLKKEIPEQRERCREAAREQYKMQQHSSGVVEFLLSADDFYSFAAGIDYITRASEANVEEMTKLETLSDELNAREGDLAKAKAAAEQRAAEADAALKAAQQVRRDAQAYGQENARIQAAQEEEEARALREAAQEKARAEAEAKARAEAEAQAAAEAKAREEAQAKADAEAQAAAQKEAEEQAAAHVEQDPADTAQAEQQAGEQADATDAGSDTSSDTPDTGATDAGATEPAGNADVQDATSDSSSTQSNEPPATASDTSQQSQENAATPSEDSSSAVKEPEASSQSSSGEDEMTKLNELYLSGREPTMDELDRPNAREGEDPFPPKGTTFTPPVEDGADWGQDEKTFVDEWSGRIDAYLAGSALDGQGKTFARAAWVYGIDPRWSPAISNTESSKGGICFLPYNAWGWGQSSWSSWEEAIFAHVGALAGSYGYTISVGAAKTYCPPNWEFWYRTTVEQMNAI